MRVDDRGDRCADDRGAPDDEATSGLEAAAARAVGTGELVARWLTAGSCRESSSLLAGVSVAMQPREVPAAPG